jgi:DNA-binding Xre family transcriptional regulator
MKKPDNNQEMMQAIASILGAKQFTELAELVGVDKRQIYQLKNNNADTVTIRLLKEVIAAFPEPQEDGA